MSFDGINLEYILFFLFFRVRPFLIAKFYLKTIIEWRYSQSALYCEEIDTSFDKIGQGFKKNKKSIVE